MPKNPKISLVARMAKRSVSRADKAAGLRRFNVGALREIAGEKAFARGVAYYKDKQVEIISIDDARVVAKVIGSELYHSKLEGTGKKFSGECSCPAFSDWGFCKHLVATALTANDLEPGAVEQAAIRLSKIRDHLRAKGIEPLVEMLTAHAYLEIAQLCVDHSRDTEALKWAEEGIWQFEDRPGEQLVFFLADLYRRVGCTQDANKLLWRSFERLPSIELYRKLKAAAESGKAAVQAVRDRAVALLQAKVGKRETKAHWSIPRSSPAAADIGETRCRSLEGRAQSRLQRVAA